MSSEQETRDKSLLTSGHSTACVMGACVICVDLVIRYIPGKQDFRIQDSNSFLACSLSLSFGVMVRKPPIPPCRSLLVLFATTHRHVQSR